MKLTAKEKGNSYEKKFGEFLIKEKGYEGYLTNHVEKQKHNARGTEVDVIAKKTEERFIRAQSILTKLSILGAVIYLTHVVLLLGFDFNILNYEVGDLVLVIFISIYLCIGVIWSLIKFKVIGTEYAWVECKYRENKKKKANIEMAEKLIKRRNSYVGNKKFTKSIFVSNTGFVNNALSYLIEENVECYIFENNTFKQIGEWKN